MPRWTRVKVRMMGWDGEKGRKKEGWQGNGGKFVFLFPFIEGRDGD